MTIGIICEYNPLHSGHLYQIRMAKERGGIVICMMSGNFTERGEAAILPKYERAKAAVRSGADLVFELPYPYAATGAAYFARAGVGILARLGIDTLLFGSESADLSLLTRAAEITASEDFLSLFHEENKREKGSAASYFALLNEELGIDSVGSNDVLGIEYLKALKELAPGVAPWILKREGAGYLEEGLFAEGHPSATALRAALLSEDREEEARALSRLPEEMREIYLEAKQEGLVPVSLDRKGILLPYFRLLRSEETEGIAECGGGLAAHILASAEGATNDAEFLSALSTRKYTRSRVRRALLYLMTGVTACDLKASPAYTTLLASSARGRGYLKAIRKTAAVKIITRPAEILSYPGEAGRESDFVRQRDLALAADRLYTLLLPQAQKSGWFLTKQPYVGE